MSQVSSSDNRPETPVAGAYADFVHLHVHSHYSLLDGLPKINELVRDAKAKGFAALALTDHGAMYGAIEFYQACRAEGIKPIIGLETYVAPRGRLSKEGRQEDKPYHLTLLAKNFSGYRNLMQLTSIGHLEGFYYRPRIDWEILEKYKDGLIVLSGCAGSQLSRLILSGNTESAEKVAREYRTLFDEDYYIEIQRQPIAPDDPFFNQREKLNLELVNISKRLGIGLAATADAHYLDRSDADAQDILVCVETGKNISDTNRLDMRSTDLSLASPETMKNLFSDLPEALANTVKISEKVHIEIPLKQWAFPKIDIPSGKTADEYLREQAEAGLARAYGANLKNIEQEHKEAKDRLDYELEVISKKGYSSYFLVVSDFVRWARARGIITTTRGSAAGSLVSYCLGITDINPLDYQLPFERFLNPERPSPPDIDTDFADNRRDEVIGYVAEKYGKDRVAQIVTFGTMLARAAVRDVGRVLGVPYSKCDKIAKLIPIGRQGFHVTINDALDMSPDLKTAYEQDPETRQILDLSKKVEGVARHASIHAAGVVISPTPLTDYTPLRMDSETGTITTQYDMHACEDAGLVKMDFLGIRNLSILGLAQQIVKKTKGVEIDLSRLPLDDERTFRLLSEGKTIGLFQLGGSGMTKYLQQLRPSKVQDIMAMIALYRPGPMESIPEFISRKQNPSKISYLDPRLQPILESSYGILTYQDDVLLIAIKLAGYSWLEADKLRKAMGKKIPAEMAEQKEKFLTGCMKNGLSSAKTLKLWKLIEPFAAYGFGRAHAASYGIVAYQTAYMKANFPAEYMAAVMTAESGNLDTVAEAVNECRSLNIQVLPPDVNASLADFTVIDDQNIRFGLAAIKNLGSDVVDRIISERKSGGAYKDLSDFIQRTFVKNFNKKSWEALAKSGALDAFGERNRLLAGADAVLGLARAFVRESESAQHSLFGASTTPRLTVRLPEAPPAGTREKLAWEKELLGLYVTSHPLEEYRTQLERAGETTTQIKSDPRDRPVKTSGIISGLKSIITKKGEPMCFLTLEDLTGNIEVVVFPRTYAEVRQILQPEAIVKISGRYTGEEDESKILAEKISILDLADLAKTPPAPAGPSVTIAVPEGADPSVFRALRAVFEQFPGDTRVLLDIPSPHGPKKPIITEFMVVATDAFWRRINSLIEQHTPNR